MNTLKHSNSVKYHVMIYVFLIVWLIKNKIEVRKLLTHGILKDSIECTAYSYATKARSIASKYSDSKT